MRCKKVELVIPTVDCQSKPQTSLWRGSPNCPACSVGMCRTLAPALEFPCLSLVQDLKEAYAANRQLCSKVVHLEAQLSTLGDTVQSLLEFKSKATKLPQVLVSNHGVDELKAQVLSLALQSNNPNMFLKSVVDGENPSDETNRNRGNTLLLLGSMHTDTKMNSEQLQLQL